MKVNSYHWTAGELILYSIYALEVHRGGNEPFFWCVAIFATVGVILYGISCLHMLGIKSMLDSSQRSKRSIGLLYSSQLKRHDAPHYWIGDIMVVGLMYYMQEQYLFWAWVLITVFGYLTVYIKEGLIDTYEFLTFKDGR